MKQALYRKYRPSLFKDVIDQEKIKTVLVNSILNDNISHAYLFAGPRGTGKTSLAKIIAKAVNCLKFKDNKEICCSCDNCLDVDNNSVDIIEIDAASNNGIDQIRELKNNVSVVPSHLKYKVYIIDEVHMLTNSAFNALLKTLEEPPAYVIFILATTEFYSVPETIVSRCQCFNFERISEENLITRLKFIADSENIEIDDVVLKEIAHFSNGGLRDAIGVLDKLHSFSTTKITMDDFKLINNLVSDDDIKNSYQHVIDGNIKNIINIVDKINENGYDFKNYVERLMIYIKDTIVNYYTVKKNDDFDVNNNIKFVNYLNKLLIELKDSLNPYLITQIRLIEISNSLNTVDNQIVNQTVVGKVNVIEEKNPSKNISREIKEVQEMDIPKLDVVNFSINPVAKKNRINNALATANKKLKEHALDIWKSLEEDLLSSDYRKYAQALFDTNPAIVGTNYIILSTNSLGTTNSIYSSITKYEDYLSTKMGNNIKIVIITEDEFKQITDEYRKVKSKGYQFIEDNLDLINYNYENNDIINKAIDVFGKDIVEIEE